MSLPEKLHGEGVDSMEETLTLVAMVGIIEELVANLPERIRKQVQTQVQRFLDQVREKHRGDFSEEESDTEEQED